MISLVFIKIGLFNVIFDELLPRMSSIVKGNVHLVGNVLYEMFVEMQDELLELAWEGYRVGNWEALQGKVNFSVAKDMTLIEGLHQKNELISGLQRHKEIKQIY